MDIKMRPTSLFQTLLFTFGGTAVQYPERCRVCGTRTKGNIFIGFRLGCKCDEPKEEGIDADSI